MISWRRFILVLLVGFLTALPALAEQEDFFAEGVKQFQSGRYRAAVIAFTEAVRLAPRDPLAHLWHGMALYKFGDTRGARQAFETASRLGGSSEVGKSARQNLEALNASVAASSGGTRTSSSSSSSSGATQSSGATEQTPTGWVHVGAIEGLLGDDWQVRDTKHCKAYARKGDLRYLEEVVGNLDRSYEINSRFMGFQARLPLTFYFFPLSDPGHTQPKFRADVGGMTRFAGIAIGPHTCLVNLGNWRSSSHFDPWYVSQVANHELNHMFLFQAGFRTTGDWDWFAEALAESIESRILPPARHQDVNTMKSFLRGYRSNETWVQLVRERDDNNVESYRAFGDLLASIVFFMQAKYGEDAIARVLKAGKGRTLEQTFMAVFGCDIADLQDEWRAFYGIRAD